MNRPFEQSAAPVRQEGAFASYFSAIRAHPWIVAFVTLAAVAASVAFLSVRESRYEATADLLVNALPQEDQTYIGLSMIRDSGDPVRTVQTAAALVESREAANITAERLGGDWTGQEVLDSVEVAPRGESNVLGITGTANSADEAAELANEFSRSALSVRGDVIESEADAVIEQLDARLATLPPGDASRPDIANRRDQLASVISGGDPTLSESQEAVPPTSALGAPPAVVVALAILAGFILGSGTAMLLELLARRVRDPEDALDVYPLPVLARVPELAARRLRGPSDETWFMPPRIREPFRTLALQLNELHGPRSAVLITSPTSGDGKTTSAINLAVSLAAGGKEVILLDFDLRNPQVGTALGIEGRDTMADLIGPDAPLDRLLFRASDLSSLRVLPLLAAPDELGMIEAVGARLPELLAQARAIADYVVIDTPPLGEVGDALMLARAVDDIVVVMRPGNTDRAHLKVMRDLLEGIGQSATGYLLVGREEGTSRGYYAYGAQARGGRVFAQGGEEADEAVPPPRADAATPPEGVEAIPSPQPAEGARRLRG